MNDYASQRQFLVTFTCWKIEEKGVRSSGISPSRLRRPVQAVCSASLFITKWAHVKVFFHKQAFLQNSYSLCRKNFATWSAKQNLKKKCGFKVTTTILNSSMHRIIDWELAHRLPVLQNEKNNLEASLTRHLHVARKRKLSQGPRKDVPTQMALFCQSPWFCFNHVPHSLLPAVFVTWDPHGGA